MNALVIGGTRNLGPSIVELLVEMGFQTSVFHRGLTPAVLRPEVQTLYGDRGNEDDLRRAVSGKDFDVVVDMALYTEAEAAIAVRVLSGRTGRYVALSTGQVYLVRIGLSRPFREEDYEGPIMARPDDRDVANWLYGVDKRAAEDEMRRSGFPAIWLRMPMVNSERDPDGRIAGYLERMRDGGPILVPDGPQPGLRHLFGDDAVAAVCHAATGDVPPGTAWNLSQDEELSLERFLRLLADAAGLDFRVETVARQTLEDRRLLPFCSPFSSSWMSSLDNSKWKSCFQWKFTGPETYLPRLVEHYAKDPQPSAGYAQRAKEIALLPPTTRTPSLDLTAAYAAEANYMNERLGAGHSVVGLKVGYASKAVWRALKLKTLVWAHMYDDTVHFETKELALDSMTSPRIEPEIVVKTGTAEDVEWIAAGFEIIDCNWPDWKFKPADFVAAGGLHAALVIGEPVAWKAEFEEQLSTFRLRLLKDGVLVEEGMGKNALGSPLICLRELASQTTLSPGDLVSTGTLTSGQPVTKGELWSMEFQGLDLSGLSLRFY